MNTHIIKHALIVAVLLTLGVVTLSALPPNWPDAYPIWWYLESDPKNGFIDGTLSVFNTDNEAILNQGQLWNMASQAIAELNIQLAPIGGVGFDIDVFKESGAAPDYYAPVNLGQLKCVSSKFYELFYEIGYAPVSLDPSNPGEFVPISLSAEKADGSLPGVAIYPWTDNQSASNFSPAVIGQAKHLFSWDIRSWANIDADLDGADGLPDFWEEYWFGDLLASPVADNDNDGLSNLQELSVKTNPLLAEDLNGNDVPDDWELFWDDQFAVYPNSMIVSLTHRESTTKQIYLNNPVSPDADFTVTVRNNLAGNQVVYGYEDSLTGGATYNWTEISETGTLLSNISSVDDAFESIILAQFSFPFYGNNYTEVFVNSNGLITLGNGINDYSNIGIPLVDNPDNFIALFWDDQNPSSAGEIYYKEESDRLIVQYEAVASYSGTASFTYQAVLHSSGVIEFFYKEMVGDLESATVGVENSNGTDGLEIAYNEAYIQDGLAIHIYREPLYFVEVSPLTGTTITEGTSTLDVTFNTFDLAPGTYTANISIAHTGTGTTPWTVPAVLEVTNPPATISITSPEDGYTIFSDESININVSATDEDFGIERVEFYFDSTFIGSDISIQSNLAIQVWDLPVGIHNLIARAIDIYGYATDSETVVVTIHADSDKDHMEDTWEEQWFGSLNEEASADLDGDGIPNVFEYNHGTDPTNAESKLNFTEMQTGNFKYLIVDSSLLEETEFKKKTISAAIESANNYDVIEVRPGTYTETLGRIDDRLYVFGSEGARKTIIDTNGLDARALNLESESVFSGLTFQGANPEYNLFNGGAIYLNVSGNQNTPRFIGCRFINNIVNNLGGAFYIKEGNVAFISCTIADNVGSLGNAIYNSSFDSSIRLVNTLLWNPGSSAEMDGFTFRVVFDHSLTRDDSTGNVLIDEVDQLTSNPGLDFDYSLFASSIARDAGTLSLYAKLDLDNEAVTDGSKDIGIDEFTDADSDGFPDWIEIFAGGNLLVDGDYDNDSLTNLDDFNAGANPLSNDTDSDGLLDGDELYGDGTHGDTDGYVTAVNNPDSDGDSLEDASEVAYGSNPTLTDSDEDGLEDGLEYSLGSNPLVSDTDGDNMPDMYEYNNDLNLIYNDSQLDKDNDGLSNLQEYQAGTQVSYFDSDGDLLPDGWEVENSLDPLVKNDVTTDVDNDNLDLFDEYLNGTSPVNVDSDNDGVEDFTEITQGSNPANSNDNGQAPDNGILETVTFTVGDPSGSNSERWEMTIRGLGPDTRSLKLASRDFGEMSNLTAYKLWKNSDYRIIISHLGTNESDGADYDWEAMIRDSSGAMLPTTLVLDKSATHSADSGNRFFGLGSWIVDNESGLLGKVDQGFDNVNFAAGKEVRLLKVDLDVVNRDDPTKTWNNAQTYLIAEPIYSGESTGDMVRWSIGDDSLSNLNFTWTAEGPNGETKMGPTGVGEGEWKIANGGNDISSDWLDWKPGKWKIKVLIGSSEIEFEQEIGWRTEDYAVIGQIVPTDAHDNDAPPLIAVGDNFWDISSPVALYRRAVLYDMLDLPLFDGLADTVRDTLTVTPLPITEKLTEAWFGYWYINPLSLKGPLTSAHPTGNGNVEYGHRFWAMQHVFNVSPDAPLVPQSFTPATFDALRANEQYRVIHRYMSKFLVTKDGKIDSESITQIQNVAEAGPTKMNFGIAAGEFEPLWDNDAYTFFSLPTQPSETNEYNAVQTLSEDGRKVSYYATGRVGQGGQNVNWRLVGKDAPWIFSEIIFELKSDRSVAAQIKTSVDTSWSDAGAIDGDNPFNDLSLYKAILEQDVGLFTYTFIRQKHFPMEGELEDFINSASGQRPEPQIPPSVQ